VIDLSFTMIDRGVMGGNVIKSFELQGSDIVCDVDGERVRLPAGEQPLERLPHIARGYLDEKERDAFEFLMGLGLGCAGVIVRERK